VKTQRQIIKGLAAARKGTAAGCALALLLALQPGCGGMRTLTNIGKTEIDMATGTTIKALNEYLRQLALALYRHNPDELGRVPGATLEARMEQIIEYPLEVAYEETGHRQGVQAVELAFDPAYRGDRVFAMMLGISGMIRGAYNGQREIFMFDFLDAQKLYNSARNLEIWKERLRRQSGPVPVRTGDGGVFTAIDKMTALQDLTATVFENKGDRLINRTIHGAATVFLPVGL